MSHPFFRDARCGLTLEFRTPCGEEIRVALVPRGKREGKRVRHGLRLSVHAGPAVEIKILDEGSHDPEPPSPMPHDRRDAPLPVATPSPLGSRRLGPPIQPRKREGVSNG